MSPEALSVSSIDRYTGITLTLFALEVIYGLRVGNVDDEYVLKLNKNMGNNYLSMSDIFIAWNDAHKKCVSSEMTKEEYDFCRYNFPKPLCSNKMY